MKARWQFILCGFFAAVVTLVSFQSLSLPSARTAILLLGYTNQAGVSFAVLQVTNSTTSTFECLVSPRDVTFRGRREIWCASTYVLSPRGAFIFTVQTAPEGKARRVSLRLVETRGWRVALASLLGRLGVHAFRGRDYQLTGPAFSRPATGRGTQCIRAGPQPPSLPLPQAAGDWLVPGFGETWPPMDGDPRGKREGE
jgi:hypothetical protein